MTSKEFKRLSRSDLLEMLLAVTKENEQLREQLEQANKQLEDRRILIRESGSLAEAALRLNGIFEAAQAACEQYTENVRLRYEQQDQIAQQMEQETRAKCERMIARTKEQAEAYLVKAKQKADEQAGAYSWLADVMQSEPQKQD